MIRISPIPPLGPQPHDRLWGQAGNTPSRSRIRMTSKIVDILVLLLKKVKLKQFPIYIGVQPSHSTIMSFLTDLTPLSVLTSPSTLIEAYWELTKPFNCTRRPCMLWDIRSILGCPAVIGIAVLPEPLTTALSQNHKMKPTINCESSPSP